MLAVLDHKGLRENKDPRDQQEALGKVVIKGQLVTQELRGVPGPLVILAPEELWEPRVLMVHKDPRVNLEHLVPMALLELLETKEIWEGQGQWAHLAEQEVLEQMDAQVPQAIQGDVVNRDLQENLAGEAWEEPKEQVVHQEIRAIQAFQDQRGNGEDQGAQEYQDNSVIQVLGEPPEVEVILGPSEDEDQRAMQGKMDSQE